MAHHYKSHCKQCHRYNQCCEETKNIDLKNQRLRNKTNHGYPFAYYIPNERQQYQKWWLKNNQPCGFGNHDCFKSPQEKQRDILTAQKSKEKRGEKT